MRIYRVNSVAQANGVNAIASIGIVLSDSYFKILLVVDVLGN